MWLLINAAISLTFHKKYLIIDTKCINCYIYAENELLGESFLNPGKAWIIIYFKEDEV